MKSEAFVRFSNSLGKERLQRRLLQPRSQGSSEGPRLRLLTYNPLTNTGQNRTSTRTVFTNCWYLFRHLSNKSTTLQVLGSDHHVVTTNCGGQRIYFVQENGYRHGITRITLCTNKNFFEHWVKF